MLLQPMTMSCNELEEGTLALLPPESLGESSGTDYVYFTAIWNLTATPRVSFAFDTLTQFYKAKAHRQHALQELRHIHTLHTPLQEHQPYLKTQHTDSPEP